MQLRRLEKLVLGANAVFWLVFGAWFVLPLEPLPINTSELQDTVNYPVSRTSHLPYEVTRSSLMWRLCSTVQFPAVAASRLMVPSFRADSTLLGGTLLVWRLLLAMLISFGQWFGVAKLIEWLLDRGEGRKRRPAAT